MRLCGWASGENGWASGKNRTVLPGKSITVAFHSKSCISLKVVCIPNANQPVAMMTQPPDDLRDTTAVAESTTAVTESPTAVAESPPAAAESPTAVAADDAVASDDEALLRGFREFMNSDTDFDSIAGIDSTTDVDNDDATAVAARQERRKPKERIQGSLRGKSSKHNMEPEVGNFGLFFGNWGARATLGNKALKKLRAEVSDRQICSCPAQVIILAEASAAVEDLLKQPNTEGDPNQEGLAKRGTCEHYVVRTDEESGVLIGARTDTAVAVECLYSEVNNDQRYQENRKWKMTRSRMLVARVEFKQSIGHIGKDVVVCGVHGHYRTMKLEWPIPWNNFWDRLAQLIQTHNIQFVAGDFNMSLTETPKLLRSRGITCECVAW